MTSKFETEATAVKSLTKNKKPTCAAALESNFLQARSEGLNIREAYEKAEFLHFITDHDGLNHNIELQNDVTTDEDVYAHLVQIAEKAVEEGDDAAEVAAVDASFRYWYSLYRSWGGDVVLSYVGASTVSEAIYEETHDLDEAEAISAINETPSEKARDMILREFYSLRNDGETVRSALRNAHAKAEEALFSDMLLSALGGGGGLIN